MDETKELKGIYNKYIKFESKKELMLYLFVCFLMVCAYVLGMFIGTHNGQVALCEKHSGQLVTGGHCLNMSVYNEINSFAGNNEMIDLSSLVEGGEQNIKH